MGQVASLTALPCRMHSTGGGRGAQFQLLAASRGKLVLRDACSSHTMTAGDHRASWLASGNAEIRKIGMSREITETDPRLRWVGTLGATLALGSVTLALSGCGGDPQEEQQDVEEAQQQVEEEQQDVEEEKQQVREEQKDVEEARDEQQEEQPQDPQRDKEKNEEQ